MIIIVGLGNPGEKFKNTRHNAGFMVVNFFAEKNGFPEFNMSKKSNSLISQNNYSSFPRKAGIVKDKKIILIKPQTFMNNSGTAVKKITNTQHLTPNTLIIIHDDIDLPLGKLKIVKNRGSAGHKGVESIIKNIGNKELIRFRIGVQPKNGKPKNPENFVIKNFTKAEKEIIDRTIIEISDALSLFIKEGLEKTMNQYNKDIA